jgi:hypothetical protein
MHRGEEADAPEAGAMLGGMISDVLYDVHVHCFHRRGRAYIIAATMSPLCAKQGTYFYISMCFIYYCRAWKIDKRRQSCSF